MGYMILGVYIVGFGVAVPLVIKWQMDQEKGRLLLGALGQSFFMCLLWPVSLLIMVSEWFDCNSDMVIWQAPRRKE